MSSHYTGMRRRGRAARYEAPEPPSQALSGRSVTSSAQGLAVLGPAPRDLQDARLTSARVLGTPRAGRGAVSHVGGTADWLRRRLGEGQGSGIPDGTLKI